MTSYLYPDADVDVNEYFNDEGGSSIYDHLASGHYAELGRRMVNGPVRVLFVATDDGARWPMDYCSTIVNGTKRVGQLTRYNMKTRIVDKGTNFVAMRTDHCPCSPGRASYMGAKRWPNHQNNTVNVPDYYSFIRDGSRSQHPYDSTWRYPGPIERDPNLQAAAAFFSDVNQAAATWSSVTAYVIGNQVKRVVNGTTRFFISVKNGTNRVPETHCDDSAGTGYWRDYGSLAAATSMLAQQPVTATDQPFFDHTSSARNSNEGRGDGAVEMWQSGVTYGNNEFIWYGTHWYQSLSASNVGNTPAIGGTAKWDDQGQFNDDLQLGGGWPTWLAGTNRVKCYCVEKYQNGIGQQTPTGGYSTADPDSATVIQYAAGTTYASGAQVSYLGHFYTSLSAGNIGHTPALGGTAYWTDNGPAKTTRFVPPAWRRFVVSADDLQDHYRNAHIDFDELIDGDNPPEGDGQIGRRSTLQYDFELASLSYSSGSQKVTAVTTTAVPDVVAGQTYDVSVDSWAANPIGGTGWVEPEVVATCVNSTTFTFTPTAAPTGSPTLTHAFLYVRKFYETYWYAQEHIDMLDDVSLFDNICVYHGFHNPHQSITHDGRNADDIQAERRYENSLFTAVPASQAYGWGGVQGAHGPDVDATEAAGSGHTKTWYQRQNMLASQDDALGMILDAWDAKFGADSYYVIVVDDNGFQYGGHANTETDAWSPVGGKTFLWENSVRVSCFIKGPKFAAGATNTRLVELSDIPLTILDLFQDAVPELVGHYAHTKCDGTSIIRKMAGEVPTLHQLCTGGYLQGTLDAGGGTKLHPKIIDKDGNVFVKRWSTNTNKQLFLGAGTDSGVPDETEYETVDHKADNGTTAALAASLEATLDLLLVGRYEPSSGTHTGKI